MLPLREAEDAAKIGIDDPHWSILATPIFLPKSSARRNGQEYGLIFAAELQCKSLATLSLSSSGQTLVGRRSTILNELCSFSICIAEMRVNPSLKHDLAVLPATSWVGGFAGWCERNLQGYCHDRVVFVPEVPGVLW